jgi:anti-sigma factor (TIGR02949 family)
MNCQEALNLLYDVIDKEASEIDAKEVKQHLQRCRDCFDKFELESSINELISERFKKVYDAPKVDALRGRILTGLDAVDKEAAGAGGWTFRRLSMNLAAVASFAALVAVAFWAADLYRHYREFAPLEKAHWEASADAGSFASADLTSNARAAVGETYGYDVPTDMNGFSLIGGHTVDADGVNIMHFIYSDGEAHVSLFVANCVELGLPECLEDKGIVREGKTFFDHSCNGCRLVYHKAGDCLVVAASTDQSIDLIEMSALPGAI